MGGRGAKQPKEITQAQQALATPKSPAEEAVGATGKELADKYFGIEGTKKLKQDFGLERATDAQILSIKRMLNGIAQWDKGYDDDKTPYAIKKIDIQMIMPAKTKEEIAKDRELFGRKLAEDVTISVSVTTEPQTDSAYLRYLDTKRRYALLGRNGAWFTFTNGGKRKKVDSWDMEYGKTE